MFFLSVDICYAQNTTESSLFQCQPTTDQSGQVFTPNIPDSYFNHANALALTQQGNLTTLLGGRARGTVFVFTIPPEATCSGTVMAFEFCYQTSDQEIDKSRDFFRFVSLTRNELQFTVIDFDPIRIRANAQTAICSVLVEDGDNSQYICCETQTLQADEQFQTPSSFGVVLGQTDESLFLTFSGVNTEFQFPHFQGIPTGDPDKMDDTFTFIEGDLQNEGSLLLLRLTIGTYESNIHIHN